MPRKPHPKMRRGLLLTLAAVVVRIGVVFAVRPAVADDRSRPLTDGIEFSPAAIERRLGDDVAYLSSDELEGRGVRTRGLDLAADYVAQQFRAAGLDTGHYNGTPFHEFRLYSTARKGAVQELSFTGPADETRDLALGADYTSLLVSPGGSFSGALVFAGYGITAPDAGYDDYADLDVRGKVVVILRHEPQQDDPQSIFSGRDNSEHAFVLPKIRNAVQHGAAAVVLCTDAHDLRRATSADGAAGSLPAGPEALLDTELNDGSIPEGIPVVHCRREIVARIIRAALHTELADIERDIDRTLKPRSRELTGCAARGKVELTRSGRTLRNVVASLAGSGPVAEETVLVGAHYDHLGRGGWGSLAIGANAEIHNGADDNASGTAVMLEVARQLAARGEPLRRRVLFIAFSAEELGLIGSRRYVQDPLVPLEQTVAMLNLDLVGRLRKDRLTIYGTGTAAEWDVWIPKAAATRELTVLPRPGGYGPSDHATFYERGIPVLHFFTGFHAEYHRPGDDAPLVNVPGMRRIAGLVADLVVQTADAETRLKPASSQSIPLLAEMYGVGELLSGAESDERPRLGVYLDDAASDRGVIVTRIVQRGAAERAGLRAGDRLLRLDDLVVGTLDDVRNYVGERKRGDSLTVEFERQGIRREVRVAL